MHDNIHCTTSDVIGRLRYGFSVKCPMMWILQHVRGVQPSIADMRDPAAVSAAQVGVVLAVAAQARCFCETPVAADSCRQLCYSQASQVSRCMVLSCTARFRPYALENMGPHAAQSCQGYHAQQCTNFADTIATSTPPALTGRSKPGYRLSPARHHPPLRGPASNAPHTPWHTLPPIRALPRAGPHHAP